MKPSGFAAAVTASVFILAGCATRSGGTSTEAPAFDPPREIVLEATGLGGLVFGLEPDFVVGELTARFGAPDRDSDWIDPDSDIFGACPGTELRAVGWGSFFVFFSNDAVEPTGRFFASWSFGFDPETGFGGIDPRELGLVTRDGIGVASTRAELEVAYGDRLTEESDLELDLWSFEIDRDAAEHLAGRLSGPEADATVLFIERVPGCEARK